MNNRKRLKPGEARVQFLACLDEIKAMLEQGHTLTSVYKTLLQSGKISMAYKSFYDLARPRDKRQKKKQ